jgi:hypothetical protein
MEYTCMNASASAVSAELSAYLPRIVARSLDVRAVWSIGHAEPAVVAVDPAWHLLVFADTPTLQRLRNSDHLHRPDVELLVVVDGDRFENAWGRQRLSGSLARWAWRQVSEDVAYYDESRWSVPGAVNGTVVRVRRRASLVWRAELAVH